MRARNACLDLAGRKELTVDASSAVTSATGSTALAEGLGAKGPSSEQFLRLLVMQLQHQDPLNPIQDQDFTAQLAQFASLEQLTQVNTNLLGLGGIQQGLVNAQALNLLGKNVLISGDSPLHVAGGHPDAVLIDAPASATSISVNVKDSSGRVVRTIDVPPGAGRRPVAWDGLDGAGRAVPDGEYSVEVVATDAQGAAVSAKLFLQLTIDGVSFTDSGVKLASGGREVSFDQILEIKQT